MSEVDHDWRNILARKSNKWILLFDLRRKLLAALDFLKKKNNFERPVDALAENGKSLSYWQLEIKRC